MNRWQIARIRRMNEITLSQNCPWIRSPPADFGRAGEFLPLAGASVGISIAGITVAVLAYALHKLDLGTAVAARFPAVNAFLANKWYLDEVNDKLFVQGKIGRAHV